MKPRVWTKKAKNCWTRRSTTAARWLLRPLGREEERARKREGKVLPERERETAAGGLIPSSGVG
jgi:hypothetical protein